MSGTAFRRLLKEKRIRVLDVAYETKLNPQTVYNFMKGDEVNASTRDRLEKYAQALLSTPSGGKLATAG